MNISIILIRMAPKTTIGKNCGDSYKQSLAEWTSRLNLVAGYQGSGSGFFILGGIKKSKICEPKKSKKIPKIPNLCDKDPRIRGISRNQRSPKTQDFNPRFLQNLRNFLSQILCSESDFFRGMGYFAKIHAKYRFRF